MYLVTHRFKTLVRALRHTQKPSNTITEDKRVKGKKKKYCFVQSRAGFKHPKRIVLDAAGVPGWLVCAWCMDKPVSEYWKERVVKLGNALGIKKEAECLEEIGE